VYNNNNRSTAKSNMGLISPVSKFGWLSFKEVKKWTDMNGYDCRMKIKLCYNRDQKKQ